LNKKSYDQTTHGKSQETFIKFAVFKNISKNSSKSEDFVQPGQLGK